jgi:cyanate permease
MAERVRIEKLSTASGIVMMGAFIGAAIGPWLGGLIFDISGNYLWALLLSAAASIIALIIALRMPALKRKTIPK